ncbi:MAG TPA: hypothetical protein VGM26_06620 [Rhizomicrobium sp.]
MTDAVVELDLPFRGTRNYIWSGDLMIALDALARKSAADGYLRKIVLRRMSQHGMEAHLSRPSDACGTFQLHKHGGVSDGWLVETTRPVERRIPFDEDPIWRAASRQPGMIAIPAALPGYDIFEQLIVLVKILANQIKPGRWVSSSVELAEHLPRNVALAVVLEQTMLGRGMRAAVCSGGRTVGWAEMVLPKSEREKT